MKKSDITSQNSKKKVKKKSDKKPQISEKSHKKWQTSIKNTQTSEEKSQKVTI